MLMPGSNVKNELESMCPGEEIALLMHILYWASTSEGGAPDLEKDGLPLDKILWEAASGTVVQAMFLISASFWLSDYADK